ncbi:MAG: molybdopterin-guanine dinucleotide biosynthesis protein MobB [Thermodesulfobacteriota bacterium]
MRAVNIVGFKNTGKTTLCLSVIEELKRLGLDPAALKFTHQDGLDKNGTDTARLLEASGAAAAIGGCETAVFWKQRRFMADILPMLGREMLVVEGGKALGVMPRVVIAAGAAEARELGAGEGGLAIAVHGPEGVDAVPAVTDPAELAGIIASRAFLLPGLDCGGCGRNDCRELAVEIVAGKASPSDCVAAGGDISVETGGVPLPLNPFVARILKAGIQAMLGELKGYAPGETTIRLRP